MAAAAELLELTRLLTTGVTAATIAAALVDTAGNVVEDRGILIIVEEIVGGMVEVEMMTAAAEVLEVAVRLLATDVTTATTGLAPEQEKLRNTRNECEGVKSRPDSCLRRTREEKKEG